MNNRIILNSLERQRDLYWEELLSTSISKQYQTMYDEIEKGQITVSGIDEDEMLLEISTLKDDTSLNNKYLDKVNSITSLNDDKLIDYFFDELKKILKTISESGKVGEMQAGFIEYDYYYHYTSCMTWYGKQKYPFVEIPRYISQEFNYNQQVVFLDKAIDFNPAWPDCNEFEDLPYLDVNIETLFQLHSRVLLHKALVKLDFEGKLELFVNRPISFYINQHDCEVMTLYWKE